ncbi:MAG: hypothetical protein KDK70_27820 [Myxococcales bacterium]|nr:hypothetical protein [Myxococcales bacterium]
MTVRNPILAFVLAATAIASAPACDADLVGATPKLDDLGDLGDLEFRGDDCNPLLANCSYRNSFYLGLEEYGIDNLPLLHGSDPNASIDEIVKYQCLDLAGGVLPGKYHVVEPDLTVDADGNLGPTVFKKVGAPWKTCTVSGQQWEGTEWFVSANATNALGQLDSIAVRLQISQMAVTPGQSTLYTWVSDHAYLYGDPTTHWVPTCDEDPSPVLDFHAVIYPSLRIDEDTGVFGTDPDTMYLGCTSGLTAKSGYTWGYDSQPKSVHQVIANAGMAKYCGPGLGSYTLTGTSLAVWNKTGAGPDQIPIDPAANPVWAPEAAWDESMVALCIGKTRLGTFQPPAGEGLDCGEFVIPPCTLQILDDPAVMFITYAQK